MSAEVKKLQFGFSEHRRAQDEIERLIESDLDILGTLRASDDEDRQRALELAVSLDCCPGSFALSGTELQIAIRALREYADPPVFTEVKPGELGTGHLLDRVDQMKRVLERCRVLLINLTMEEFSFWPRVFGKRWAISHEPLRGDAVDILGSVILALGGRR